MVEVGGDLLDWLAGRGDPPGFELFACELCGDQGEEGAVAVVRGADGAFLDSLDGAVITVLPTLQVRPVE
jgi:hypothetical protein